MFEPLKINTMKKTLIAGTLIFLSLFSWAQSSEEEAVRKAIQAEVNAVSTMNLDAYAALWKHDEKASFYFFSPHYSASHKGWDSIFANTSRDWKTNPEPQFVNMHVENLSMRITDQMALAEYDMVGTPAHFKADVFPYIADRHFHLFTTFVKENGQWKIAAQAMTMPDAYNKKEYKMEMDLTIAAYNLMAANRKKKLLNYSN